MTATVLTIILESAEVQCYQTIFRNWDRNTIPRMCSRDKCSILCRAFRDGDDGRVHPKSFIDDTIDNSFEYTMANHGRGLTQSNKSLNERLHMPIVGDRLVTPIPLLDRTYRKLVSWDILQDLVIKLFLFIRVKCQESECETKCMCRCLFNGVSLITSNTRHHNSHLVSYQV